jgi:hypothetical protein
MLKSSNNSRPQFSFTEYLEFPGYPVSIGSDGSAAHSDIEAS